MLYCQKIPAKFIRQVFFASNLTMKKEKILKNIVQSAKKIRKREKSPKF